MHTRNHFCSLGSIVGFVVGIGVVYMGTVSIAFAEGAQAKYVSIIGIPGVSNSSSLPTYINNIYRIAIGVGAIFAVIKIALAGVKYSMSGIVTDKAEAKKDIKGVLIGLAILLLPAVVLGTINPKLLNLDVLSNVGKVGLSDVSIKGGTQINTISSNGSVSGPANNSSNAGDTIIAVPNCETTASGYDSGCAKTACDGLGGTLTEVYTQQDGLSEFSRCSVHNVYTDP